jgi:hypothetical protein
MEISEAAKKAAFKLRYGLPVEKYSEWETDRNVQQDAPIIQQACDEYAAEVTAELETQLNLQQSDYEDLVAITKGNHAAALASASQYRELHRKAEEERDAERAEVARLLEETDRLRAWVNDLHSGMYINCVYCGHRYGPNDEVPESMSDVLKRHVEQCPAHPMSKLKSDRDALREALRDVCELARVADGQGYLDKHDKALLDRCHGLLTGESEEKS